MGTPKTQPADAGQAEERKTVDKAEKVEHGDKGYIGRKVDPLPNSAHSMQSGPDSPPVRDAIRNIDIADLGEED